MAGSCKRSSDSSAPVTTLSLGTRSSHDIDGRTVRKGRRSRTAGATDRDDERAAAFPCEPAALVDRPAGSRGVNPVASAGGADSDVGSAYIGRSGSGTPLRAPWFRRRAGQRQLRDSPWRPPRFAGFARFLTSGRGQPAEGGDDVQLVCPHLRAQPRRKHQLSKVA